MKTRVLLVDDEKAFVGYTAKRLRARGMEVEVRHDAESAIRMVQEHPVDIIVLDLLMPGMDGLEALRVLKQTRASIPVIMLSGHGNIDAAEEGRKFGAVEYLLKPCSIDALSRAIERHVSGEPPKG